MEKPFSSEQSQKERARIADLSNAEILAMYEPICSRFSEELKRVLEQRDTGRLEELGFMAALHCDMLDRWFDAIGQYSPDSNLLILRDYFHETVEDILAALNRDVEKGVEQREDDADWWKNNVCLCLRHAKNFCSDQSE
jgi:hypothetical protein